MTELEGYRCYLSVYISNCIYYFHNCRGLQWVIGGLDRTEVL